MMADEGAVQSAFNAIVQTVGQTIQTLQDVVAQNAQGVAAAQSSVSTMADSALAANQALATNVQTGGATTVNKTILYIVIAAVVAVIAVVIGIVSFRKRK
jgi:t-SNARE complex subunit (syntaxin)